MSSPSFALLEASSPNRRRGDVRMTKAWISSVDLEEGLRMRQSFLYGNHLPLIQNTSPKRIVTVPMAAKPQRMVDGWAFHSLGLLSHQRNAPLIDAAYLGLGGHVEPDPGT